MSSYGTVHWAPATEWALPMQPFYNLITDNAL